MCNELSRVTYTNRNIVKSRIEEGGIKELLIHGIARKVISTVDKYGVDDGSLI